MWLCISLQKVFVVATLPIALNETSLEYEKVWDAGDDLHSSILFECHLFVHTTRNLKNNPHAEMKKAVLITCTLLFAPNALPLLQLFDAIC